MRILGLDVGTKTIGVAVSDPLGFTAQGVKTIRRSTLESDLAEIRTLVESYQVEEIVVGLPLNMNGSEGPSAAMAREMGEAVAETLSVRVIYRDERLSTMAAERILLEGDVSRKKRKQVIDKMAAAYILQGYLDYLARS